MPCKRPLPESGIDCFDRSNRVATGGPGSPAIRRSGEAAGPGAAGRPGAGGEVGVAGVIGEAIGQPEGTRP